ncbi:DUF2231 domain-containing protein [Sulfobacillus harzensis]|nr:DUF2231 domain-containing protein [Sulfobacillus harzensis]
MAIWNAILGLWIRIGLHLFPPVIHPMLVHFPIVLLYGSLFTSVLGLFFPRGDRFFSRASFWLLALGLIAGIVAAAAGVISEQYVKWTPVTSTLLSTHQAYAVLTGLFVILALISRLLARFSRGSYGRAWSFANTGRGRETIFSWVFVVASVVMVTMTASIGGTMVYQYGVGVHGLLFHTPALLHSKP